jgi:ketosteroid isomerase-like protein
MAVALAFCGACALGQQSLDEQAVWKLEHVYWDDVKALDLEGYKALWHSDFVGWPFVSAQPVRKDGITNWITAYTSKGMHLESYALEPAASKATGPVVVVYYWATQVWTGKDGRNETFKTRVTHTWVRDDKGWKIIGGMSSPEPKPASN